MYMSFSERFSRDLSEYETRIPDLSIFHRFSYHSMDTPITYHLLHMQVLDFGRPG